VIVSPPDPSPAALYVGRLLKLTNGGLAEVRDLPYAYLKLVPPGVYRDQLWAYRLIAQMVGSFKTREVGPSLATTLQTLNAQHRYSSIGLEHQVEALLNSSPQQQPQLLWGLCGLADQAGLTWNWTRLLDDILGWTERTKERWACDFYLPRSPQ
jgi:CRISPR type I-E-associated protein CasB/Cse2